MDKELQVKELLNTLPIPFTTRLVESDDEFRHAHGFFECFYITEGAIVHECNGKTETLTEGVYLPRRLPFFQTRKNVHTQGFALFGRVDERSLQSAGR